MCSRSDTIPADEQDEDERVVLPLAMGRRDYRFECTPSSAFVSSGYTSTPAIIAILAGVVIALNCVFIVAASVFFAARRAMHASQVLQQTNAAKGEALRILRKSQAVAESHNQSKTDFLAFLCHELRNPVRLASRVWHVGE
jgi:signal transduction histidine kinase